jgi:hypothetical protein
MSERGRRIVVVAFTLVAVGLMFVASAVKSYLPLFFVWIPQLAIPVFLSRTDRNSAAPAVRPEPEPPAGP